MRPVGLKSDGGATFDYRLYLAVAAGALSGGLTLAVEELAVISENPILGAAQHVLFYLLFPGMLGSMAVSGNVHAFQLWVAAAINGLIYFGVAWLMGRLVARLIR
jgi:hypothetical protein